MDEGAPRAAISRMGHYRKGLPKVVKAGLFPYELVTTESDENSCPKYIAEHIKKHKYWAVAHVTKQPRSRSVIFPAELCKRSQTQLLSFCAVQTDEIRGVNTSSPIIKTGTVLHAESYDARTPFSYIPDVTNVSLDLLIDAERGVWNLINGQSLLMPSLKNALRRYKDKAKSIPTLLIA